MQLTPSYQENSLLAKSIFEKDCLPKLTKIKVTLDIKKIIKKRKFLNKKKHILMGVLNMTPDSFSDGGKFNFS